MPLLIVRVASAGPLEPQAQVLGGRGDLVGIEVRQAGGVLVGPIQGHFAHGEIGALPLVGADNQLLKVPVGAAQGIRPLDFEQAAFAVDTGPAAPAVADVFKRGEALFEFVGDGAFHLGHAFHHHLFAVVGHGFHHGGVGCKAIALVRGAAALDEDADRFGKFVISEFVSEHVAAAALARKPTDMQEASRAVARTAEASFFKGCFIARNLPFPM